MPKPPISSFRAAAPFWLSLTVVPAVLAAAWWGGWALGLPAAVAWWLFTLLDALAGQNHENPSTDTDVAELFWYRAITVIWFPVQMAVIFGLIFWARHSDHLAGWEQVVLFLGVGVISGTIGIVYAHELLHQPTRAERWLGDLLLASVLYSHFRSEHLLVHHRHVGTPRDAVTARYNEGFHRFLRWGCWRG